MFAQQYATMSRAIRGANVCQLPQPRDLLFIEPEMPILNSASESTTPTNQDETDPMSDAFLASMAQSQSNAQYKRLGKIGTRETGLPDVHAEPSVYYGGPQVWSRARTFSDVSSAQGSAKTRLLHQANAGPRRWGVKRFSGPVAYLMVSWPHEILTKRQTRKANLADSWYSSRIPCVSS